VVLGLSLVNMGEVVFQEGLTPHGLAHLSMGERPLGETFPSGKDFHLLIPMVLGQSSLGQVLGRHFC